MRNKIAKLIALAALAGVTLTGVALTGVAQAGVTQARVTQGAAPPDLVSGGSYVLGQQPDGNSIIIHAPRGAIIVDTGRHSAHLDAVLARVAESHQRPVALINTHWHLDHVGGNVALRRAYPGLPVYATNAIQQALPGFLADYRRQLEQQLAALEPAGGGPSGQRQQQSQQQQSQQEQGLRAEIALIDAGQALAPDHVVAKSGAVRIAGKSLELTIENHAHSGADLWIRDPAARVVIAGDLVVLPTPFLDTSCPPHILTALNHIAATRFDVLYPGHGPALSRSEFERYRNAYADLLSCAASAATTAQCAAGWRDDLGALLPESERATADALIAYYMDASLRAPPAALAALCGTALSG